MSLVTSATLQRQLIPGVMHCSLAFNKPFGYQSVGGKINSIRVVLGGGGRKEGGGGGVICN